MVSPLTVATASPAGPSPLMPLVPKMNSEPMKAATTRSRPTCKDFRYRRITVIIGALRVGVERTRGGRGPALLRHHAPRDRDEPGVRDHPVERPDRLALDVPGPVGGLERLHERPGPVVLERLGDLVGLDDRRHVAEEDPARTEHGGDRLHELPRLGQVEEHAVRWRLLREPVLDGAEPNREVRHLAEAHVDVGHGPPRELAALLVGDDAPVGPDRAQEGERERARARARLDDAAARVDVGPEQDHRQVLGVDDLRTAGHVEHVLAERGAEREIAEAQRGPHPGALGLADDRVVRDPAAVGVERLRLPQEDQVALAALIDEQDLLTVLERAALVHWISLSRGVGRKRAVANPASGMSALSVSAVARPQWSATQPSAVTPRPPAPIAKPTMSPDAMPALRGR